VRPILAITRVVVVLAALLAHAVGVPLHLAAFEHFDVGHASGGDGPEHVHTGPIGHGSTPADHAPHSVLDHREAALLPSPTLLVLAPPPEPLEPGWFAPLPKVVVIVAAPETPPPKPPPIAPARARAPPLLLA
jgi:hypothetical protein